MEIKELQKLMNDTVDLIDSKLNCKHDANNTFLHLIEEIGEVAEEVNKPNIRNKETDIENLGEEIADCVMMLTKLAVVYNIDLENAVKDKIEKLKKRHNIK